jgi:S1-C subfamily serine protease
VLLILRIEKNGRTDASMTRRVRKSVLISILGFAGIVVLITFLLKVWPGKNPAASPLQANDGSIGSSIVLVDSFATVVSRVAPAVVTIRSEKRVRPPKQHPFINDPFSKIFSVTFLAGKWHNLVNMSSRV